KSVRAPLLAASCARLMRPTYASRPHASSLDEIPHWHADASRASCHIRPLSQSPHLLVSKSRSFPRRARMTPTPMPFPQHHRGLCLALCAALSLATLAWPTSVSAQVADTARAAAIDAANARAIELFKTLSEAKSDSARDQAISALHAMAR